MNPRVLSWLRARGLTERDITRVPGEDVPRITDGTPMILPWTTHYVTWISARWAEWAATKGYTRGWSPHADAQRDGQHDFDEWLTAKHPPLEGGS